MVALVKATSRNARGQLLLAMVPSARFPDVVGLAITNGVEECR
jgi:hypothetical protein